MGKSEDGVLGLMRAIDASVRRRQERFLAGNFGLTLPQYQLLLEAVESPETNLGALAERMGCSRGNLTGIADRLERGGWICRDRSTDDRRVVHVHVTEKGQRVGAISAAMAEEMQRWIAVPNEETAVLVGLLRRGISHLSQRLGKPA